MFLKLPYVCLDARQLAQPASFVFGLIGPNGDAVLFALFFESIVCAASSGRFHPLS